MADFGQKPWNPNCNHLLRISMGSVDQAVGVAPADIKKSAATPSRDWRALQYAMVLAVVAALIFTFAPVLLKMGRQCWRDPNFSHGFLVPLFSAFLVWQRRDRLAQLPAAGSWTGALVLVFGLGVLIVGSLGTELFLTRISLMFVICGLVAMLRGWAT